MRPSTRWKPSRKQVRALSWRFFEVVVNICLRVAVKDRDVFQVIMIGESLTCSRKLCLHVKHAVRDLSLNYPQRCCPSGAFWGCLRASDLCVRGCCCASPTKLCVALVFCLCAPYSINPAHPLTARKTRKLILPLIFFALYQQHPR